MKNTELIIIGSGYMSREYIKVLNHMHIKPIVVGRGQKRISELKKIFPEIICFDGGLESFFKNHKSFPKVAINTSSINSLNETNLLLIKNDVKKILVEKPGDLEISNLNNLRKVEKQSDFKLVIGYNRRFYENIQFFKNKILNKEKILSAHFEFTEWVHKISPKDYSKESLSKWITSNSSHVIDTVFYLIGFPNKIFSQVHQKNSIKWHESGSIFTGCGQTVKNIPFTYNSNWISAGRWSIEISTNKYRYYFRPMEKIFRQKIGSIDLQEILIDKKLDSKFKPGLYLQTKNFLNSKFDSFVTINEQINMLDLYNKIGNY